MKRCRILITGSEGLIGAALGAALAAAGHQMVGLDLRAATADAGDVRDRARVAAAAAGCDGVVHLAAISRVAWAERDPVACWHTNVRGLAHVIDAAERQPSPAWLVFASSREVYGEAQSLPATESSPRRPVNVYGQAKVEGELLVQQAAERGLRTAIVRFSNVYGHVTDHADRVVPAFARAAALGGVLRVEGRDNSFDFTHVDDVVDGMLRLVERLACDQAAVLPPIHFVSGQGRTLGQLAALAVQLGGRRSRIVQAPPRRFDVGTFCGCGSRAHALLNWTPRITLEMGLARLIEDFRRAALARSVPIAAPH